jgi:tetratricopeptide (TPR) repeat protein
MKPAALFLSAILFSFSASAQSPQNNIVSVQDLALSGKAAKAFTKGTDLLVKGDNSASIEHLLKAIQLAPSSYRPYHNLALAYLRLGQLDQAAADFQKSIDLTKGAFAPSLFGLSMILYKRAEFLDAKLLAERGLDADPTSAVGKYCLGLIQFSLGHLPEAERSALDAIARGGQIDAYLLLAQIHARAGNPLAVLTDVQTYLTLAPAGALRPEALSLLESAQLELSPESASRH